MEKKEILAKQNGKNLISLFEKAHQNPEFKREFLCDPQGVAQKFDVTFTQEEVDELKKLGMLSDLAAEIKYGRLFPPNPVGYPPDLSQIRDIWRINELADIFANIISESGITFKATQFDITAQEYTPSVMSTNNSIALHPEWVFYPVKFRNLVKNVLNEKLLNGSKVNIR